VIVKWHVKIIPAADMNEEIVQQSIARGGRGGPALSVGRGFHQGYIEYLWEVSEEVTASVEGRMSVKAKFEYPNDPISDVELMFGEEFLGRFPSRETRIVTATEDIRIPVDDVICDSCNGPVRRTDPCALLYGGSHLYCWDCYSRNIKPHLMDE